MKFVRGRMRRNFCLAWLMLGICDSSLSVNQSAMMKHFGTFYNGCARSLRSTISKINYAPVVNLLSSRVAKIGGIATLGCLAGLVLRHYRTRAVVAPPMHEPRIAHQAQDLPPEQMEGLARPVRIGRKFYNVQDGTHSRLEPLNCFIDSTFIGLSTKVNDFGVALKRLLNRTREADRNAWRMVPQLRDLEPTDAPTITWIGHSTFLIQINGLTILTDAIFGDLSFAYKRRVRPVVAPEDLPHVDVVLLSHNHRDHMDTKSLLAIRHHRPLVLVPTNNGGWFRSNGFTDVVEKSWWQQERIVRTDARGHEYVTNLTCVPAQHWSTRMLVMGNNDALCSGWHIADHASGSSIYFAGDTAYNQRFFEQIRNTLGAPTVALMPIGPNEPRSFMDQAHMSTEQAVDATRIMQPTTCIPMHHATFGLGIDAFDGPINRLRRLAPDGRIDHTRVITDFKFGQQFQV